MVMCFADRLCGLSEELRQGFDLWSLSRGGVLSFAKWSHRNCGLLWTERDCSGLLNG